MFKPGEDTNSGELFYQKKLDEILSTELTAENINTYADGALNGLVGLIDEIKNDPAYKWDFSLKASSKEQEDEMFNQILGINVGEALERIDGVGDDIRDLDRIIQKGRQNIEPMVYIPPGDGEIIPGSGDFVPNKIVPKAKIALFVLESEFDINLDDQNELQMSTGVVTNKMMRQMSYDIINVPTLNRIILSCDETGNRTYIFDTEKLTEEEITIDDIKNSTKQEVQELLDDRPAIGADLRYSKNYPVNLIKLIQEPIKVVAERIENNPEQPEEGIQPLKEVEEAPEGWATVRGYVGRHKDISEKTVNKLIEEYNKSNESNESEKLEPVLYKHKKGRSFWHYKIEDLDRITEGFRSIEKAPEGWVTVEEYARMRKMHYSSVNKLIEEYNKSNESNESNESEKLEPVLYKHKKGNRLEYYRIEDLDRINKGFRSIEKAPEGWVTVKEYAKKHDVNYMTAYRLIKKHNESNESEKLEPVLYKHKKGRSFWHYKIEDLDRIMAEREQRIGNYALKNTTEDHK